MSTSSPCGTGPLTGVKVLELAGMGPVAFTGMLLADLGADVLRVDRPGPPRVAAENADMAALTPENDVLQRGKASITADLKTPEGLARIRELITKADVVLESFRPGVVERLGLGPADALALNPRLVYARLSGYGQDGALRNAPGHDINYLALSGILQMLGQPGSVPMPPVNLLADYAAGGLLAAFGVTAALVERARSGLGQIVDAAMSEGLALLGVRMSSLHTLPSWDQDRPGTNQLDGGAPYYRCYETKDGRFMAVGAIEGRYYAELVKRLVDRPDELPPQNDRARWPELHAQIAAAFKTRDQQEWATLYEGVDACVSPVLTQSEAAEYLTRMARPAFRQPADAYEPLPAPRFSRTPARPGPLDVAGSAMAASWGLDT